MSLGAKEDEELEVIHTKVGVVFGEASNDSWLEAKGMRANRRDNDLE